jgi:hypothetical protein
MIILQHAQNLGVNIRYLARAIQEMKNRTEEEKDQVLRTAESKIPKQTGLEAVALAFELGNDISFCEFAHIDYATITEKDTKLIRTALAYYLMYEHN